MVNVGAIIDVSIHYKMCEGFTHFKGRFHRVSVAIDRFIQVPKFIIKCAQLGIAILCLFPAIAPGLERPKRFSSDVRYFCNLIRGFKTVDRVLDFKLEWRAVVLNVAGISLFVISSLIIGERYDLFHTEAIKGGLTAIPVFGVLPFGGLYFISMAALTGMLFLFAREKKQLLVTQQEKLEDKIKVPASKTWEGIEPSKIEEFRKAKADRWQAKLNKLILEKKAKLYDMAIMAMLVFKQIITIGAYLSGVLFIPLAFCFLLDLTVTGVACAKFFLKRTINEIKIPEAVII